MSGGGHNIALRTWLRKIPQPVAVLADEKRIEVPRSGRPWHELEGTIIALAPSRVTLLDGSGNILRSKEMTAVEEEGEKTVIGSDLQTLAKLVAEAYDKGGKSYEPLLNASMTFIERQGQRLAQMEREIEKLRAINAKLQAELLAESAMPEPSEGSMGESLLTGILQAQAAQAAAEVTPIKKGGR